MTVTAHCQPVECGNNINTGWISPGKEKTFSSEKGKMQELENPFLCSGLYNDLMQVIFRLSLLCALMLGMRGT